MSNEEFPEVDYSPNQAEDERCWQRRYTYAEALLYRVRVPSADEEPIRVYEPATFARQARKHLVRIDMCQDAEAAEMLARAAAQLVGLARFAWWPWSMTGDLDVSADEKPYVVIDDVGWDDGWLGHPRRGHRRLFQEARRNLDELVTHADRLEASGAERVRTKDVENAAYGAVEWAQNLLMLAVDIDPTVVLRVGRL